MCGIAGIYKFNSKVLLDDLRHMTDVIIHRGPDGEGHWLNSDQKVGFGHRRLSIIDLSDLGKQPMQYLNKQYTITFNGEIYNYIELREDLKKKGYSFISDSDTEVLLALYDCYKENCLGLLDGMFAFAIWDEKEQQLFCARDRFGEKPFHYYYDKTKFVFGSEIKQLWAFGISKKVTEPRLKEFIDKGIIENLSTLTETFYEGIKKLDAAHYLILKPDGDLKLVNYWKINSEAPQFSGTIDEATSIFLNLFKESIRLRLRSDVPVGSSLSGGLDSSSIVMLIDSLKGEQLEQNTFSARFKNFAKDEGKFIEEVVKNCKNVKVHYTWPDKDYFAEVFDKVAYHQDEPFGSASIVAQYAVMEIAKKHNVTVLLDGQGADEQMAGYLPYYSLYLDQLNFTNSKLFKKELEAYSNFHGNVFPYVPSTESETVRMKFGRYRRKMLGQNTYLSSQLKQRLINDTCQNGLKELLRYADRNSMAHSREVRLPFLSHKLVEFIFSLPVEYLLNMGWTKFVLRKAMDKTLPNSICWRVDKIGYEPPQKNWLDTEHFQKTIKQTSKQLGVIEKKNENTSIFNQEWRLLMASKYI